MPQPNELLCIVNDTLPPKTYTNTTVLTYVIPFPFVNQNDVVVISRNGNVDTILENQAFNALVLIQLIKVLTLLWLPLLQHQVPMS